MLPPARRCRSSPPRTARRRAVLLLLAAGRGSEQGRRWAAPVDARHAGRVPALPPSAWTRSAVGPPDRRAEAGCPWPVATVEAACAARFVPPVFSSSFFGGARVLSSCFQVALSHLTALDMLTPSVNFTRSGIRSTASIPIIWLARRSLVRSRVGRKHRRKPVVTITKDLPALGIGRAHNAVHHDIE